MTKNNYSVAKNVRESAKEKKSNRKGLPVYYQMLLQLFDQVSPTQNKFSFMVFSQTVCQWGRLLCMLSWFPRLRGADIEKIHINIPPYPQLINKYVLKLGIPLLGFPDCVAPI